MAQRSSQRPASLCCHAGSGSSKTDVDNQSKDVEKDMQSVSGYDGARDLEKSFRRGLQREATRNFNLQAVPGTMIGDEEDAEGTQGGDDQVSAELDEEAGDVPTRRWTLSRAVSRVLTAVTSRSSWSPGLPPDGGPKAWTAVACGHLVIMNTWGFINSFGIFQSFYAIHLNLPPSTISWIGSLQVFLLFFIGTFTGRLTDAGFFRPVFFLGSVFQVLGIFATSVCTQYWQILLAQGVCMGLGNGCLFCPALAIVSTYFSTKRGLAIGITACGSATGGLIFPAMARQLLDPAGFSWTVRAIGFIQLLGLTVANLFLRPRVQPRRKGSLVDWRAFKELEYTFYAAGSFTCFLGVYFAFYYLASFSRDVMNMSNADSVNLLLILNGVGIIGRLVPNYIADRIGAINVFIPTALIAGICQLSWIAVTTPAGLHAWSVFYGIAAGGIQSLFPAGLSSLTTDLRKAGVRMGMVFTINSFATLVGPPIAGVIISRCNGKYYGAQVFAGAALIIGAGFMVAARVVMTRKVKGGWRVKV